MAILLKNIDTNYGLIPSAYAKIIGHSGDDINTNIYVGFWLSEKAYLDGKSAIKQITITDTIASVATASLNGVIDDWVLSKLGVDGVIVT